MYFIEVNKLTQVKHVGFKTGFSANFADLYRKKEPKNRYVKNNVHCTKSEKINNYVIFI